MYIMNSIFKKTAQRKWTWRSPDGKTKNEIDFIITTDKQMVQDVFVINQISISTDHRTRKQLIKRKQVRKKYDINALRHNPDKNDRFMVQAHSIVLTPTKQMIKERRIQLCKNGNAKILNEMSKKIKREIRKDIRTYNTNCIDDAIERNKGPKIFQKQISWRKEEIHKHKNPNGRILTNKDDIINAIKDFCQELSLINSDHKDHYGCLFSLMLWIL